jgi:hypothetical protein
VIRNTNATIDTALNAAKEAAREAGKNYSVLAADWTQANWSGLPIV